MSCDCHVIIKYKSCDVLIHSQGYVSVLKEGFGFIEVVEHDCELFFPFRYTHVVGVVLVVM